jgi:hypothetical protein
VPSIRTTETSPEHILQTGGYAEPQIDGRLADQPGRDAQPQRVLLLADLHFGQELLVDRVHRALDLIGLVRRFDRDQATAQIVHDYPAYPLVNRVPGAHRTHP